MANLPLYNGTAQSVSISSKTLHCQILLCVYLSASLNKMKHTLVIWVSTNIYFNCKHNQTFPIYLLPLYAYEYNRTSCWVNLQEAISLYSPGLPLAWYV